MTLLVPLSRWQQLVDVYSQEEFALRAIEKIAASSEWIPTPAKTGFVVSIEDCP